MDRIYEEPESRWHGRIVSVGRRTRDDDYTLFSRPGVYPAACVFFGVLYGDPTGLAVTSGLDVSATDAASLQGIAGDAVAAVGSGPR